MQPTFHITAKATAASSKRILLVDVLRAFALFGIIINHITMSYLAGPSPAGKWMSRYQYGLVEWLWRSLTYMKMQPMQRVSKHESAEPMPEPADFGKVV